MLNFDSMLLKTIARSERTEGTGQDKTREIIKRITELQSLLDDEAKKIKPGSLLAAAL